MSTNTTQNSTNPQSPTHRRRPLTADSVQRSVAGVSLADSIQSISATVPFAAISCRRILTTVMNSNNLFCRLQPPKLRPHHRYLHELQVKLQQANKQEKADLAEMVSKRKSIRLVAVVRIEMMAVVEVYGGGWSIWEWHYSRE
ncbi:hypothetical protein A2U01_0028840, partial [Trifolium medium]|nr:hypothetical protein [Trifolium medium]